MQLQGKQLLSSSMRTGCRRRCIQLPTACCLTPWQVQQLLRLSAGRCSGNCKHCITLCHHEQGRPSCLLLALMLHLHCTSSLASSCALQETIVQRLQQPCSGPSLLVENEHQAAFCSLLQQAAEGRCRLTQDRLQLQWAEDFAAPQACWCATSLQDVTASSAQAVVSGKLTYMPCAPVQVKCSGAPL